MIYKISVDGQKSILNMPAEEADRIELIKKEVGGPAESFELFGYEMYYNDQEEIEEETLNTVASQLAGIAMYGDVVIVGKDMSPLIDNDIVLVRQEIEARKHHKINFPPPDHENYY